MLSTGTGILVPDEHALQGFEAVRAYTGDPAASRRLLEDGLAAAGEAPNFVALVRRWGGVSIVYRKRLVDSPAYRLNHEEVSKALEEGIVFAENLDRLRALLFRAVPKIGPQPDDLCASALDSAIVHH